MDRESLLETSGVTTAPATPALPGGATQSGAPNYQFFEKTFRVLNGEQVNFPYPSLRTRSFCLFPANCFKNT